MDASLVVQMPGGRLAVMVMPRMVAAIVEGERPWEAIRFDSFGLPVVTIARSASCGDARLLTNDAND
eukprot:1819424-Lingulodinium_polyedra.AAC.1